MHYAVIAAIYLLTYGLVLHRAQKMGTNLKILRK